MYENPETVKSLGQASHLAAGPFSGSRPPLRKPVSARSVASTGERGGTAPVRRPCIVRRLREARSHSVDIRSGARFREVAIARAAASPRSGGSLTGGPPLRRCGETQVGDGAAGLRTPALEFRLRAVVWCRREAGQARVGLEGLGHRVGVV